MSFRIHVIDFEGSTATGVVEAGVVTLADGAIEGTWTSMFRPRQPVPWRDSACHHLSDADLLAALPFATAWDRFRGYRASGLLAAHHAAVEDSLLRDEWATPPLSPLFVEEGKTAAWGPWIDTRRLYAQACPDLTRYGLGDLVTTLQLQRRLDPLVEEHCPASRNRPHCALYDALAAALLLQRLEAEGFGCSDFVTMSQARSATEQGRLL